MKRIKKQGDQRKDGKVVYYVKGPEHLIENNLGEMMRLIKGLLGR